MTRAEQAAEKVRKAKEKAAELDRVAKEKSTAQDSEVRKAEAVLREETRKVNNKRRYHVGALADEAGLFAWSNTDLAAVFATLTRLKDAPNPAAVLDVVLSEAPAEILAGGFCSGRPVPSG